MNIDNNKEVIKKTIEFVKETFKDASGDHDWWHIYRVWKLSKTIAEKEDVDIFVVELGALLHDIADYKFHNGDESIGPRKAREFLESISVDEKIIYHIENIIKNISFSGVQHKQNFKSNELNVVQDADRLDAIGAIGIGRTFSYGGYKGKEMFNPDKKPNLNMTKEEYKNNDSSTINHFYEKLFLLKERMNTSTGMEIAKHRHNFMKDFVDEFYEEWDGKS